MQVILRYKQVILIGIIVFCGVQASHIYLKAWLAQLLLADAWQQTLTHQQPTKPWPWADLYPIAKLVLPAQPEALLVLENDTNRSLAFGPGQLSGSSLPGQLGSTIYSGHRDTHFKALEHIKLKETITIQDATGQWHRYQVNHLQVVDSRTTQLTHHQQAHQLLLTTCYPFNAVQAGGPLRYVVFADYLGPQTNPATTVF